MFRNNELNYKKAIGECQTQQEQKSFYAEYIAELRKGAARLSEVPDKLLNAAIGGYIQKAHGLGLNNFDAWLYDSKALNKSSWILVIHGLQDILESPDLLNFPEKSQTPAAPISHPEKRQQTYRRRLPEKSTDQFALEAKLRERGLIV